MTFPSSSFSRESSFSAPTYLEPRKQSGLPLVWETNAPLIAPGRPFSVYSDGIKRLTDVVLAALAIVVLLPLLLGVAIAVRTTTPGPALFRQKRVGKDGKTFGILKFRTIRAEHTDHKGLNQTVSGDQRVTTLGRLLRRTNIDELPQLLNILWGDMSVVGPRPHVPNMLAAGVDYRNLVPYYDLRSAVRPGLTGWAQANGLRGPTTEAHAARARVNHDIAYIQNISLWLDLRILWLTMAREFSGGTGS